MIGSVGRSIQRNANVNSRTAKSKSNAAAKSLLFQALENEDYSLIKDILKSGVDINAKDKFGNTVLHMSCNKGLAPMVQDLIKEGASVDVRNKKGKTPLTVACESNISNIVQILVSA